MKLVFGKGKVSREEIEQEAAREIQSLIDSAEAPPSIDWSVYGLSPDIGDPGAPAIRLAGNGHTDTGEVEVVEETVLAEETVPAGEAEVIEIGSVTAIDDGSPEPAGAAPVPARARRKPATRTAATRRPAATRTAATRTASARPSSTRRSTGGRSTGGRSTGGSSKSAKSLAASGRAASGRAASGRSASRRSTSTAGSARSNTTSTAKRATPRKSGS